MNQFSLYTHSKSRPERKLKPRFAFFVDSIQSVPTVVKFIGENIWFNVFFNLVSHSSALTFLTRHDFIEKAGNIIRAT